MWVAGSALSKPKRVQKVNHAKSIGSRLFNGKTKKKINHSIVVTDFQASFLKRLFKFAATKRVLKNLFVISDDCIIAHLSSANTGKSNDELHLYASHSGSGLHLQYKISLKELLTKIQSKVDYYFKSEPKIVVVSRSLSDASFTIVLSNGVRIEIMSTPGCKESYRVADVRASPLSSLALKDD